MAFTREPGWPFAGFFVVTPSIREGMILSLRTQLLCLDTLVRVYQGI
jgi:hypothetical protein